MVPSGGVGADGEGGGAVAGPSVPAGYDREAAGHEGHDDEGRASVHGVGTRGSSLCTPPSLTWLDHVVPSQKRIWWWPAGSGYQLGG